jgi:hypothetical protein
MSAVVAAEFVKCVSAEEVRARLASGRRFSALVVDSTSAGFDRDLVEAASSAQIPTLVVGGGAPPPPELGAAGWLPAQFGHSELLEALAACCQPVASADRLPAGLNHSPAPVWLGQLFTVVGPGGTGASTAAIALAQGLAHDARHGGRVLLADLARRADQAMLHDAGDLGPGFQELAEAHRRGRLSSEDVWNLTLEVPTRRYRLLLGLRRPESWSVLRPRAVEAAIEALRRAFRVVVADVTGDLEDEDAGGSADVEERNYPALAAVARSSVVVAFGAPGMKGTHTLAWLLRSLLAAGVTPERLVPAVNQAPRSPVSRAQIARAIAGLVPDLTGSPARLATSPLFLPERKVEEALAANAPLPAALVEPLTSAVKAVSDRQADSPPPSPKPTLITPGSLGVWAEAAERDRDG